MEKKTDISLEDCQGWSIKVKINDAGKVVSETGFTRFIVKMHDGDVVFDGAESVERLAEDMLNACALRKALDVARDMYINVVEQLAIHFCPHNATQDMIDRTIEANLKAANKEFNKATREIMKGEKE